MDSTLSRPLSTAGPSALSHKRLSAVVAPNAMDRRKTSEKRRNYYAVVRRGDGHEVGKIFESWQEAEVEIKVSSIADCRESCLRG
jgi:hypothetical protein